MSHPHSHHADARARRHFGAAGSAWWLMRCLLVFVLVFDHLSAPFHLHEHDGAADGRAHGHAAAHASFDDGDVHAEADDHGLPSHSAMAIRIDPSQWTRVPAASSTGVHAALLNAVAALATLEEPPPVQWRPDRSPAEFRSHRSLPPAGRAPPLHA